MGLLSPVCFATDGNKIYGFGFSAFYAHPGWSYNYLIVSNSNPDPDLSDITWKLVSTIGRDPIYYLQTTYLSDPFDCTVDDQGVFTILARSSRSYPAAPSDSYLRGVQYRPSGYGGVDTSATNGTWVNVDVSNSPKYYWDSNTWSTLAVFKDPTTKTNTVMHFTNNYLADGFYVAALNQTTPMLMNQSAFWPRNGGTYGTPQALTFANGTIYTMALYNSGQYLTALPITSPSLIMPTTTPIPNNAASVAARCGNAFSSQLKTFGMGNKVVISCVSSYNSTMISVFDPSNAANFSYYNSLSGVLASPVSTVPVLNGNGRGSFIFYADMYGRMSSIPLSGTNSITYLNQGANITVLDQFGIDLSPPTPTPNNSTSSSNGISTGAIVGIIVAFLVVAFGIYWVVRKRNRQAKEVQAEAVNAAVSKPLMADKPKNTSNNGNNSGQNPVTFQQHQQHFVPAMAQAAVGTNTSHPTTATTTAHVPGGYPAHTQPQPLPQQPYYAPQPQQRQQQLMYQQPGVGGYTYPQQAQPKPLPATPPQTHPYQPQPFQPPQPYQPQPYQPQPFQPRAQVSRAQPGTGYPYAVPTTASRSSTFIQSSPAAPVQSVQSELQQQFNFSSHPRPSVVTSVKPVDGSQGADRAEAPLPPVPNVWEPKPFVPPVKNPSPNMQSSQGGPSSASSPVASSAQGYASGYGYGASSVGGFSGSSGVGGTGGGGSGSGSVPASGTVVVDYAFTNTNPSAYGSPHTMTSSVVASPSIPSHSRPT